MPPTTRFLCPVDDCDWTHDEPAPEPPDSVHDVADAQAAIAERMQEVEQLLVGHFESHGAQEWAQTVSNLRMQLAEQPQQIACLACVVAQHNAQREGLDAGPIQPAFVIANGSGICLSHLQISDGPVMSDRTKGGIVLPRNASRLNGGAN